MTGFSPGDGLRLALKVICSPPPLLIASFIWALIHLGRTRNGSPHPCPDCSRLHPAVTRQCHLRNLGGTRRTLRARQRGLEWPPPSRFPEDEGNEPLGMAREARETRGTRRQPSGRTEFPSRANPLPQLPCLASSRALTSLLSVLPGAQPRVPSPAPAWTSQQSRTPAIPPRARVARPPLTRPAIFADTSGSETAAPHSAEPAPAARVPDCSPPSRRRASAGGSCPRPAASPAPFPSPCARASRPAPFWLKTSCLPSSLLVCFRRSHDSWPRGL